MQIALVSQKGGVGKSSLARLIAVEMQRAGWRTLIADLDPAQATSTTWGHRRADTGREPEIDCLPFKTVSAAVRRSERNEYDLVIYDGPAHAERGGLDMAKAADLVLLPASYSIEDLEPQVKAIYELADNKIDHDKMYIALWGINGSSAEGKDVRKYLQRAAVNVLQNEMPQRASIQQAQSIGLAASEVQHSSISDQAKQLAVEVSELLSAQKQKEVA